MRWTRSYRIIPSRHPPVQLFERIGDPSDWENIARLETLTNPRARDAWGEIELVPAARRVSGAGASWVMAPFTHVNPRGSRFSDSSYGVYYAAHELETAIAETVFHMGSFYRDAGDPPHREDMRVLVGAVDARLHDVRGDARWAAVHDPGSYAVSQALARQLRDAGSDGLAFPSARRQDGDNIAAFWPDVVKVPVQGQHLQYDWTGTGIDRYFDYGTNRWAAVHDIPGLKNMDARLVH